MISKTSQILKDSIDSGYITADVEKGIVYWRSGMSVKWKPDRARLCQFSCRGTKLYVHRVVAYAKFGDAALEPGMDIDHINHNTFHNQGDNLRILPHAQNANEGRPNASIQRQSMAYKVIDPITSHTIGIFPSMEAAQEYAAFKCGDEKYATIRRRRNGTWYNGKIPVWPETIKTSPEATRKAVHDLFVELSQM